MEIRHYPDPVLRQSTEAVAAFDQALANLAAEMLRTMRAAEGLGLAAPQIGVSRRIAIVASSDKPGQETVLVNPELVAASGWEDQSEEGCLSFPGVYIRIGRFTSVRVRHQDLQGQTREMEAQGILARAVQHELDHLDGRLLVDRMSPVQRLAQRRRLRDLESRFDRRTAAV
ncbi:MAG: peptide deformylase [Planctomycetes bacterium]|nr:peptide deformylase [Planctomycetota bacterium]